MKPNGPQNKRNRSERRRPLGIDKSAATRCRTALTLFIILLVNKSAISSACSFLLIINKMSSKPCRNDMEAFRKIVQQAQRVVILTGAGVSAESGVPTFRGAGGFWRIYNVQELATAAAFRSNPSLVWEFFHYRRENMASNMPNKVCLYIIIFLPQMMFYNKSFCHRLTLP